MHPGLQLAGAMWALVVLALVQVALRLYARVHVVKFVGAEDYVYAVTGILFLSFAALVQVAAHEAFGRPDSSGASSTSPPDTTSQQHLIYIADTLILLANALAKLSISLFLIRYVQTAWHKAALWSTALILSVLSLASVITLWAARQTTHGSSSATTLLSLHIATDSWSVACDFFLAAIPWLFVFSLQIPRRDQAILVGVMSLGVLAGACGIARAVILSKYNNSPNTLGLTIPYFGLFGAETFVSMACVGLPILWPLIRHHHHHHQQDGQSAAAAAARDTFGASTAGITHAHARSPSQFEMNVGLESGGSSSRPSTAGIPSFLHSRVDSVQTTTGGPLSKPSTSYSERSSSSIPESVLGDITGRGVIWVSHEIEVSESAAEWPLTKLAPRRSLSSRR